MITKINDEIKDINKEVWWKMMLGRQQNSEECEPICCERENIDLVMV